MIYLVYVYMLHPFLIIHCYVVSYCFVQMCANLGTCCILHKGDPYGERLGTWSSTIGTPFLAC